MEINRKKRLNNLQFYPETTEKKQIFLHHTAGLTAQSSIDWWNQTPEAVGAAYVIDRDGTIHEVFDPKCWCYELGLTKDRSIEKTSIGIEIVSAGGLIKEADGQYYFYALYPSKVAKHIIPAEEVWEMPDGWRGFNYYHKYSDAQVKALSELLPYLIDTFKIQVQQDMTNFFQYNPDVELKHLPGIWSHSTVRTDKMDIIPNPNFLQSLAEILKKSLVLPSSLPKTSKPKKTS